MEKKPIITTLLIIGGALLIYTAAKASKFLNGLQIEFTNIGIGGNINNPRAFVTLKILNPTNLQVTVSELTGKIFYKNKFFANVESMQQQIIPAAQIVYFDLELYSSLGNVLDTIKNIVLSKAANDFSFDGSLKINGVQLPYKGKLNW